MNSVIRFFKSKYYYWFLFIAWAILFGLAIAYTPKYEPPNQDDWTPVYIPDKYPIYVF